MINLKELREEIEKLVSSSITFDNFNNWLNEKQWNLSFDSPTESKEFYWAIENCICDFLLEKINYEELISRFEFIIELDNVDVEMLK